MGSNSLLLEMLNLSWSSVIILIKTITTAVELIKAEMLPVINMTTGNISMMFQFLNRLSPLAIHEITPFCSNAAAMIIRHSIVMTAWFENPLIASSGVVNPDSVSTPIRQNAILSIGKISKAKNTMSARMMKKTKPISTVILREVNNLLQYR
jgi:hypothetical protein